MNPLKIKIEYFGEEFLAKIIGNKLYIENFDNNLITKFASWTGYEFSGYENNSTIFTI